MNNIKIQTEKMIDELKTVCTNFGLSNDSSEYKIITEMFLYKFLNDKFIYNYRSILGKEFEKLHFNEIEKKILELDEEQFSKIHFTMEMDTALFNNKDYLISQLSSKCNDDNFYKIFDDVLINISNDNLYIFSVKIGDGNKVELFESVSQYIIDTNKKNNFCRALISKISSFSFEEAFKNGYDFFATIFEYLLKDYNKDSGKYAEYYTPHSIAKIMADILVQNQDEKSVKIYDPSAGTGTLVLALAHKIGNRKCSIYTQDISQKANEFLRLNLILQEKVDSLNNVIQDDTLLNPRHYTEDKKSLLKFDYIVSNPPFKMDFSDNRNTLAGDNYSSRFFAGVPNIPNKDKDKMAIYLLFIQHIIYSLNEKGKAAIVVPTGFLTAITGIDKKIREYMVDNYFLRGVISMPSNVFANTGTNVSIIFLDKSIKNENVILMDASNLGIKVKDGKNQRIILREEDISLIVDTFNKKESKDDLSILVNVEDIKTKNYSFSAGQYFEVKIDDIELTESEFNSQLTQFQEELKSLFAESHKLEKEIFINLDKIEYE